MTHTATVTPAETAAANTPIPERPALPLLGHALDIPRGADGLLHLVKEVKELGPVYRVRAFGNETVVVGGLDLVAELADETRFRKNVHQDLVEIRQIAGDGLFTAYAHEPNWQKAHDILMPAFSLGAMRGYHATMLGVARSLIAKWDRMAGSSPVDVPADMTRLTFDTIGLCGFGYDFESFRSEKAHPFVDAMGRALAFTQTKSESLPGTEIFRWKQAERFRADAALMTDLVDEVIRQRRASGDTSTDDLLGRMLHTRDAVTGEPLDDLNIRHQVITFLIAGHETTSGALSFALHYLTKHPEVLARAQAEVDALWGDTDTPSPSYGDVGKLTYLRQVLNESLRLWPTAPAFAVEPLEDTVIGGTYPVRKGETLLVLTPALHRDAAWGENVELFDPERFAPEREAERPVHLFKPFGSGERACIGRQFALHEATLLLGLIVHRYRLIDHADYQLKLHQSLTIKPDGLTLGLARRTTSDRRMPVFTPEAPATAKPRLRASATTLTLLHGSNLGTCAGLARDLAAEGDAYGFSSSVAPLDARAGELRAADGPLVVVAASYNGRPTDDAVRFVERLDGLEPGALEGLRYAVLGVGDRNWAATYQYVPTLIDERLRAAGAVPLLERGAADASGDFAGTVDRWSAELWAALLGQYGGEAPQEEPEEAGLYALTDVPASVVGELADRHGVRPMRVVEAYELVDMEHELGRSKRFLKIRLPEGTTYRTGDHLAVLPRNSEALVRRVADRFGLDLDRTVRLDACRRSRAALPVDRPLTLRRLLTEFVELQHPATPEQIALIAEHTACPPERQALLAAGAEAADGRSVLDVVETYASCTLPFERFLETLPVLRPRQYSISSSAQASPGEVDLMVSLLAAPHRSAAGTFRGVASSYVQTLEAGDEVLARVLPCAEPFRLPADDTVPAILISAGTGLAPFRGAVLDRLHQGSTTPLLCYFGCDHPDVDHLHREEFERAEAAGAVGMRPTYSRAPQDGVRYVQDRMARESAEIWAVLEAGGHVRVCGDGRRMAPAVREALMAVYREHTGAGDAEAVAWLDALKESGTYVEDVWAG
ncbi:bifunctional cytochrome P450/NADPH--P450 reductase 1 [Streptomyces spiroverticillatus]|uniref:Bifunctional cytochrome P450/NADPH--P450 reductase n=1 Tax=Streptomyces finlayi TaxID=67296 RepID=A0A919CBN5_9ACTN|nr:cytochrome P450 [Streptomyces finlayi]GHA17998.1 bifunctional cytochrome P450/NADPH--P450 reductase 1 [Streptomyces spiroverticillatus]GHC99712.1 bifunctional cytochrome P450/NADPH--P450 reductase 1 [Streptomyces finlayi]